MTGHDQPGPPAGIDTSTPNPARIYDALLGGKDNFPADRAAAHAILNAAPQARRGARENRAFLQRAVRFLAAEAGIRQFLDIGTGLPTQGNVHQIAQQVARDARVVYVDHDPVVHAHADALLADQTTTLAVLADLRQPQAILDHSDVRGLLDLARPVAVLLVAVLHFITEAEDPAGIVAWLREAMAPGSYLVISHATGDFHPHVGAKVTEVYGQASAPLVLRSRRQIERFFDGFDLVEPGLVEPAAWRPDAQAQGHRGRGAGGFHSGVGRQPASAPAGLRDEPGSRGSPARSTPGGERAHRAGVDPAACRGDPNGPRTGWAEPGRAGHTAWDRAVLGGSVGARRDDPDAGHVPPDRRGGRPLAAAGGAAATRPAPQRRHPGTHCRSAGGAAGPPGAGPAGRPGPLQPGDRAPLRRPSRSCQPMAGGRGPAASHPTPPALTQGVGGPGRRGALQRDDRPPLRQVGGNRRQVVPGRQPPATQGMAVTAGAGWAGRPGPVGPADRPAVRGGVRHRQAVALRSRAAAVPPVQTAIAQTLARLVAEGLTDRAIGQRYGKSPQTVVRWRLADGLVRQRATVEVDVARVQELRGQGLPIPDVAATLGYTPSQVSRASRTARTTGQQGTPLGSASPGSTEGGEADPQGRQ